MRSWVVAVVLALLLLAVAPAGATRTRPTLKLAKRTPVTVHGVYFKSLERVTVTATVAGIRTAKRVRASQTGSFTLAFGADVVTDRCSGFVVRAVGARGSVAVVKLPQLMCAPALRQP